MSVYVFVCVIWGLGGQDSTCSGHCCLFVSVSVCMIWGGGGQDSAYSVHLSCKAADCNCCWQPGGGVEQEGLCGFINLCCGASLMFLRVVFFLSVVLFHFVPLKNKKQSQIV